jgi:hypothetical protein
VTQKDPESTTRPRKGHVAMSSIHLLNEIVSHRELSPESWSAYISYSLEEATGTIIAETFFVYYNALRPSESRRQRVGQARVSYNKAPFSLLPHLRMLEDIVPAQPRDTISFSQIPVALRHIAGPAAKTLASPPA